MKTLLSAAVAAAAMFAAAPAMAAAGYGSLGYSVLSVDAEELDADIGMVTARIGAKFTDNFGLEGEANIGAAKDTVEVLGVPVDVEVKSLMAAYVVGFVPLGDQFEVLGRVGLGTMKVEAEAEGFSVSETDEGLLFGVGAQFFPTEHHGIRLDYTGSDSDAGIWSVAYAFRF